MHPSQILEMHIVGRPNEKLLLLLRSHLLVLLLLQLHVPVFVLAMRQSVI